MAISHTEYKHALARFASGVTIVATRDADGRPRGLTVSAFSSLSVEPPLVLACIARSADSAPALLQANGFSVSVLGDEHAPLALRFATKGDDKFHGTTFDSAGPDRAPSLPDALASFQCRTVNRVDAGDHVVLIGEVTDVDHRPGKPLLYFDRRFRQIDDGETLVEKAA